MPEQTPEQIAALEAACAARWMLIVSEGNMVHRLTYASKESALAKLTEIEAAMNGPKETRNIRVNSQEGVSSFDVFAIRSVRAVNDILYLRSLAPWIEWKVQHGAVPAAYPPVSQGGAG